ncbi:MAG: AmmeMemoRadiSam system protein B [Desulfobacteraceae bacterium]|nr:AmmeMemoRadiSam system protein B [Desulfobacteraceae bacterium]
MELRKAVFAGSWYPDRAEACDQEIETYLSSEADLPASHPQWVAGIVPHAGWYYSGRIACQVIHQLKGAEPIDLVVVFGMHLHPGSPNYMMTQGAWETPYGELPVAEPLAQALLERFAFQVETPRRFNRDNTVELQLPFIKRLLDPAAILAIGVPPTARSLEIGRAVADWAKANKQRLRIVGSTDLTHYGENYGFSPHGRAAKAVAWVRDENDRRVIDAMLAMAPEQVLEEGLSQQNACCSGAAATAIAAAKQLGATQAKTIAYATSYDKSPGDSFVGYAGVVFG